MSESAASKTARSRREQGLPPKVADPKALARLAVLFTPTKRDTGDGRAA